MRKILQAFSLAALFTLSAVPSFAQSPAKGGRFDTQIQQDAEKLLQSKPKFQNIKAETDDAIVTRLDMEFPSVKQVIPRRRRPEIFLGALISKRSLAGGGL